MRLNYAVRHGSGDLRWVKTTVRRAGEKRATEGRKEEEYLKKKIVFTVVPAGKVEIEAK